MSSREAMLERVKQSVAKGNRAGIAPSLPQRSGVGYQGAGTDPVRRFCQELAAVGGKGHVVANGDGVMATIQDILKLRDGCNILLSRGGLIERLNLGGRLKGVGMNAKMLDEVQADPWNDFFAADVGITNVHRLIAETGTVVLASNSDEPRSVSLLPPVHIAIAERWQLLPDLFDLFDLFSPVSNLPSCVTLITGPSKTGDIELKLVTGVHGPGEVHVIVIDS
jgi:L-lactate utilization protein LutC